MMLQALWGDLSRDELKKFGILSLISMLILGNYWTLRVMKNAIFGHFVEYRMYQPWAKVSSVVVIAILVMIYSKLVDTFSKEKLFYLLVMFFACWELGLAYCVANPTTIPLISGIPGRLTGWIAYVSIEAIPLMISLFWAIIASTTSTESAKRGYGLILFVTQIGTIGGSAFVVQYASILGIPLIVALSSSLLFLAPFLMKFYLRVIPGGESDGDRPVGRAKTGFIEGLVLLLSRPYVMGIFIVATMYQVIGTILEFQMNSLGKIVYPVAADFAAFHGKFGIGINLLALCFALFGTSFFMRKFGLRLCLIAFPTIVGAIVSALFLFKFIFHADSVSMMWALFFGMICVKGLNYALNGPSKEVLYIPTSTDVKFKSKGWIDLFGNRSTKGAGAGINILFKESLTRLFFFGSMISLGLVGIWIVIAALVGRKFERLL